MIQANQIRLGNWVRHNNTFCKPEMQVDLFLFKDNISGDTFPEFEPIPLTPDILIAAGFEFRLLTDYPGWYSPGTDRSIRIWAEGVDAFVYSVSQFHTINVSYLHQLQNLVHALTGKELTITLHTSKF